MYRLITTLTLTLVILMSAPARAVDIGITDGSLSIRHVTDLAHNFELIGPQFRLFGGRDENAAFYQLTTFTNASSRGMADLDGTFFVVSNNPLTYQGQTAWGVGSLNVSTPAVPLAPGSSQVRTTLPFSMTGTITMHSDPTGRTPALETFNLIGQGTAVAAFTTFRDTVQFGGAGLSFEAVEIGNGPVIPEPSTVLLVASGLAGLGLWRWRESKRHGV